MVLKGYLNLNVSGFHVSRQKKFGINGLNEYVNKYLVRFDF
jgi:hypothetical protein